MKRHSYKVLGTVLNQAGGMPTSGLRIEAWDRDLLFDDPLGTANSDEKGRFEIAFDRSLFRELIFDRRPDVFFRLFNGDQLILDTRDTAWCNLDRPEVEVILAVRLPIPGLPKEPDLGRDDLIALRDADSTTPASLSSDNAALHRRLVVFALDDLRGQLESALASRSKELRDHVLGLDLSPLSSGTASLRALVRNSLLTKEVPEALREEGLLALDHLVLADELDELIKPETPIRDNPLYSSPLGRADCIRLGALLELDSETIDRLVASGVQPTSISDRQLNSLIEAGVLDEPSARTFGAYANLYHLADARLPVVERVTTAVEKKHDRPLQSLRDLTSLTHEEIRRAANDSGAPREESDPIADRLHRAVETLFPDDVLAAQLAANGDRTLTRLYALNPDRRLLSLDTYDSGSIEQVAFGQMADEERSEAIAELRKFQRLLRLTGGKTERALRLEASGASGAYNIQAELSPKERARADRIANGLIVAAGVVVDWYKGSPLGKEPDSTNASESDSLLRELPEFGHYFGNQDYCLCRHCQSILSPSAYFFDLMWFIEKHLSVPSPDQPLSLHQRRPDLWTGVPLTCACTESQIPYLTIINEILENYIDGADEPTPLTDRAAVEGRVYEKLYKRGDATVPTLHGFAQPALLPLDRLQSYLAAQSMTCVEIVSAVLSGQPELAERLAQARLGISAREYAVIAGDTSNATDPGFLAALYRFDIPDRRASTRTVPTSGAVEAFEAQRLLEPMGVSRAELGTLIAADYVRGSDTLEIRSERSRGGVQLDIEAARGFTASALDRMHRFTRLWKQVPWSIEDLDLVLTQLGVAPEQQLPAAEIATLAAIGEDLEISAEELCGLVHRLPTSPTSLNEPSLFDRLFNAAAFVREPEDRWDTSTLSLPFVHPIHGGPDDGTLARLLAGLRIDDVALRALLGAAAVATTIDLDVLSLWYQHSRLAEALSLSVSDLLTLISLSNGDPGLLLHGVVALEERIASVRRLVGSGYGADELAAMTATGDPDGAAQKLASELIETIAERRSLTFADTLFAFFEGVTEEQSHQIIAHNPSLFKRTDDDSARYRLTAAFDPLSPLSFPPELPRNLGALTEAEAQRHVARFHVSTVFPPVLASKLRIPVDRLTRILSLAGYDLTDAALHRDLTEAFNAGSPSVSMTDMVATALRLTLLFGHAIFTTDALEFVAVHAATLFDISDFGALTTTNIETIAQYRRSLDSSAGADGVTTINRALGELRISGPAPRLSEETVRHLADAYGFEPGTLRSLESSLALPTNPITALAKLRNCAGIASKLGVTGELLVLVAASSPAALTQAANAILAGLRRRYPDQQAWEESIEPTEDRIRELKRDALSDYIRRTMAPEQFREPRDLYHWFLVDTQLQGCARTSRVVAANASLQLYVQRCLMRLEQGDDGTVVEPGEDAAHQWAWRHNYRLWEANRRVFLYPESYLLQSIRDNKTELFRHVESELLTGEIERQAALDAYGTYLTAFADIADLKIAGAFHDHEREEDVLHLFGCNRGNPPDHYYRTVKNVYASARNDRRRVTWGSWSKINVQIPVREVSPVVHRGRLFVFWNEIVTHPDRDTATGRSRFVGYRHKFEVKFTSLRLDGTWTAPQSLELGDYHEVVDPLADGGDRFAFRRRYPSAENRVSVAIDRLNEVFKDSALALNNKSLALDYPPLTVDATTATVRRLFVPERAETPAIHVAALDMHLEPRNDYTLTGYRWTRPYPSTADGRLFMSLQEHRFAGQADLFSRELRETRPPSNKGDLDPRVFFDAGPRGPIISRGLALWDLFAFSYWNAERWLHSEGPYPLRDHRQLVNLHSRAQGQVVNGALSDVIFDVDGDLFYLHLHPVADFEIYAARRLSTTLTPTMRKALFEHGVEYLLMGETQKKALAEKPPPFDFIGLVSTDDERFNFARIAADAEIPDFTGPLGVYFREIFLHLPWRVAEHLNEQQRFEEAHRWFRYILDPTQNEVWQYVEFDRHARKSLREQLDDLEAIEVSATDPFNPHAIARTRLGAYMRGVWMKQIDNLLDWGDHLFSRDTMESIGEATLLYSMAADLLGPRPVELGACREEATPEQQTYEALRQRMRECPQTPLTTLEDLAMRPPSRRSMTPVHGYDDSPVSNLSPYILSLLRQGFPIEDETPEISDEFPVLDRDKLVAAAGKSPGLAWKLEPKASPGATASLGASLLQQACVLCIPPNPELLALWDRVEDRLDKIRHCMNIDGLRRQLELFAPPIDPALLVQARAAGLSMDDIVDSTSSNLPPYRFSFLISKAKEYASALQGFGAALLSAIERRDAEELARQKLTHEKNILALQARLRDQEVEAAEEALEALTRRYETVSRRRDHQQMLINEGLSGWEQGHLWMKRLSMFTLTTSTVLDLVSAPMELIPKILGMASSTGGEEAAKAIQGFARASKTAAEQESRVADALALEGSFQRRRQGWEFQLELANLELREIESQIAGQKLRIEMTRRAREIHERGRQQLDETFDFYREKFTNLELYSWLSSSLQRLYRQAYGNALSLLRLAEHAYRFERSDDRAPLAAGAYLDGRAGLLAGEKLMADIRDLERRYMETNHRGMEIDQAFSLSQIAPRALIELRQTGECDFTIPEAYFDLFYPGHYRRRIRSVRLTIPSVTGPYTNVSATLTLLGSRMRMEPDVAPEALRAVPPTRAIAIATSNAQNDAGVFRVDFRDERYMPFEGAGAVESHWRLRLPKSFRPFDYSTINDVILHIAYTAEYAPDFVETAEASTGTLMKFVTSNPLPRALSLRQEFSSTFNRLLHTPTTATDGATFELTERHFPLFLQGRILEVSRAWLLLDIDRDAFLQPDGSYPTSITNPTFALSRDGATTGDLVFTETLGRLPAAPVTLPSSSEFDLRRGPVQLAISVTNPGDFGPATPMPSDPSPLDDKKLHDALLYLEYSASESAP